MNLKYQENSVEIIKVANSRDLTSTWLIMAVLAALLFALVAVGLHMDKLTVIDSSINNFIHQFKSPSVTAILKAVTYFGSSKLLIFLALYAFYRLRKANKPNRYSAMVILSLGGSFLLNDLLKNIFERARPEIEPLVAVTGYSFPSGHAMISTAFYGLLLYLLWLNLPRNLWRYVAVAVVAILIGLIGFSRVYLGVHYPSDVIAGYAAGLALLFCLLAISEVRS